MSLYDRVLTESERRDTYGPDGLFPMTDAEAKAKLKGMLGKPPAAGHYLVGPRKKVYGPIRSSRNFARVLASMLGTDGVQARAIKSDLGNWGYPGEYDDGEIEYWMEEHRGHKFANLARVRPPAANTRIWTMAHAIRATLATMQTYKSILGAS